MVQLCQLCPTTKKLPHYEMKSLGRTKAKSDLSNTARMYKSDKREQRDMLKTSSDLLTNSQDFLVDSVPEKEGLFIAAGGSFHAFKFLPVLGQEVLQTVEGKETIYQNFWSVKSHQAQRDPVHQEIIPKRNF